jgi:hypothetical protein
MKVALFIITLLNFCNAKDSCERLKDGVYLAKHTSPNGAVDYRLTIAGDACNIQVNDTLSVKGKVKWIADCSFKIEPNMHKQQDTTELAKKLYQSFGEPFIEIKATKADTTFFRTTWTGNLHITINEGYFLRVR